MRIGFVTSAQPPMIIDEYLIMFCKLRHLKDAPRSETDACARDKHQRISLAVQLVIEVDVINFDFAAL